MQTCRNLTVWLGGTKIHTTPSFGSAKTEIFLKWKSLKHRLCVLTWKTSDIPMQWRHVLAVLNWGYGFCLFDPAIVNFVGFRHSSLSVRKIATWSTTTSMTTRHWAEGPELLRGSAPRERSSLFLRLWALRRCVWNLTRSFRVNDFFLLADGKVGVWWICSRLCWLSSGHEVVLDARC